MPLIDAKNLTDKQKKRLENIQFGLRRNGISAMQLSEYVDGVDYSTVWSWTKGKSLTRKTEEKLDILEAAYAKALGLQVDVKPATIESKPIKVVDNNEETTLILDMEKLIESMSEVGLSLAQVRILAKTEAISDEDLDTVETLEISKKDMKKLEKLFGKPKGYFQYVEPEPEPVEPEPVEETSNSPALVLDEEAVFKLTKCQEELQQIKNDMAQLRENFLNLVKAFNNVEDGNAEIYRMVKEMHYDLIGTPVKIIPTNGTNQAGV